MSQVTNTTPNSNQHIVAVKSSTGTDSIGRAVTDETGGTFFSWAKDTWLGRIISNFLSSLIWSPPEEAPSSLKERVTERPLISSEYSEYCFFTMRHERPYPKYQTPGEFLKDRIKNAHSFEELDQIVSDIETTNSVYLSPAEKTSLKDSAKDLNRRMDILEKSLKQCIYPGEMERSLKEIEALSKELAALSITDIPFVQIGRLAELKTLANPALKSIQNRIIDQYKDGIKYASSSDNLEEIISSIQANGVLSKPQKATLIDRAKKSLLAKQNMLIEQYNNRIAEARSLGSLNDIISSIHANKSLTKDQKEILINSASLLFHQYRIINHYNDIIKKASSLVSLNNIISSIPAKVFLTKDQKEILINSAMKAIKSRFAFQYFSPLIKGAKSYEALETVMPEVQTNKNLTNSENIQLFGLYREKLLSLSKK